MPCLELDIRISQLLTHWPAASIQIYFGGDRGADGWGHWGEFFLILDLKMAICGAYLVQFFAVQLVALHAKSSAYERIEQKAAKQGYWKLQLSQ